LNRQDAKDAKSAKRGDDLTAEGAEDGAEDAETTREERGETDPSLRSG